MRRELERLAEEEFDLLVVGGGILGALAARDASLRGLRTALVDREDFGSGTSSNSLGIAHGGLRYLQHLDFPRMRESLREQSLWLRLAPHLVQPLPVLVPGRGVGRHSPALLRLALAVTETIRPRGVAKLPRSRVLGRDGCLQLAPELEGSDLRGGVLFHDCQFYSPERIVLSAVRAAVEQGAAAANYAEVISVGSHPGGMTVGILDRIGGERVRARARALLNAAGSAAGQVASLLPGARPVRVGWSVAFNVVTAARRHRVALALRSEAGRYLFFVPWRGRLAIGTGHRPYSGDPARFDAEEDPGVASFLEEVNGAWPDPPIAREEILLVQAGLLPAAREAEPAMEVRLLNRPVLLDHGRESFPGAVTAIAVKFTTARRLAEGAVDLLCRQLGRAERSRSAHSPLPGSPDGTVAELASDVLRRHSSVRDAEVAEHLARSYGTTCHEVLACGAGTAPGNRRVVPEAPVIRAQLMHAVRHEMAMTPEDLVWRRTDLGPRGLATREALAVARQVLEEESRRPCAESAE